MKDPLFSVWPTKTRTLAVGSHNLATDDDDDDDDDKKIVKKCEDCQKLSKLSNVKQKGNNEVKSQCNNEVMLSQSDFRKQSEEK